MIISLLMVAAMNFAPNTDAAQKTISSTVTKQMNQEMAASLAPSTGGAGPAAGASQEVMIITPLDRANDLVQAYAYIKQPNVASAISLLLKDKSQLSNILDIQVMKNGTRIIVKLSTLQGEKYRLIKTEDIDALVVA